MVVVYGTVCLDRICRVSQLPVRGGYVEIDDEVELVGGEAANTALALTGWGEQVVLYSNPLGCDHAADQIRDRLIASGIHHLPLSTPVEGGPGGEVSTTPTGATKTPVCDIYVTPDGERTMFGRGFKNLERVVDLEGLRETLERDMWFTAEPNHGRRAREAVRMAEDASCRIYLLDFFREDDAIPSGSFWQSSTDWVAFRDNTERNREWLSDFVARHAVYGILTDGASGFVAGGLGAPVRAFPPLPCTEVVDSTGAGDIFRAGMLFGLARNWPVADCLRYASAAASLKCRSRGATSRLPTRDEIDALIASNSSIAERYG